MKFLLICFQEMSGLTINFVKSEVMVMGYSDQERSQIANLLNCQLGSFPMSYLGLPVSDNLVRMRELRPVVDKVEHRVDPWQGRLVTKARKAVLVVSSLASLPMFAMGLYLFPEGAHTDMEKFQ